MSHTIVLVQYTAGLDTRSYMEFPTVNAAMDALVKMYEHKLKELNPSVAHITYDVSDLFNFLDSLSELVGLVLNKQLNAYEPKVTFHHSGLWHRAHPSWLRILY